MNLPMVRVPLVYLLGSWRVLLPTYAMVPGTIEPLVDGKVDAHGVLPGVDPLDADLTDLTVLVEVPYEYVDQDGQLRPGRDILALYEVPAVDDLA